MSAHTAARPVGAADERWGTGAAEVAAVLLLVGAALSPATAPTAVGLVDPAGYASLWSTRLAGGASLVDVGLVVVAGLLLLRGSRTLSVRSTLDLPAGLALACLGLLHFVALQRNGPGLLFQGLDLEFVALAAGGYLVVTRLVPGPRAVRLLVAVVAGSLALSFVYLVLRYGLLGSTQFGVASGRTAVLVTEDSLLVAVPVVLAWGLGVDRLLSRRLQVAAAAMLVVAVVVDLASLRRGGLIFLSLAVALRSLWAPRRWLVAGLAIACVGGALALVGPARPLLDDARYVVESALLQTKDASTSQRQSELENFSRNLRGPADVMLGKGLGAVWNAEVASPLDSAAFGSGETAYVRVGWHVYGLDWLYKLGVLGVLAVLGAAAFGARRLRRALKEGRDPVLRSLVRSLGVLAPVLLLFLFTNLRIAFFTGVTLGLVSSSADALERPEDH